jgi:hypothetical protein
LQRRAATMRREPPHGCIVGPLGCNASEPHSASGKRGCTTRQPGCAPEPHAPREASTPALLGKLTARQGKLAARLGKAHGSLGRAPGLSLAPEPHVFRAKGSPGARGAWPRARGRGEARRRGSVPAWGYEPSWRGGCGATLVVTIYGHGGH